MPKLASIATELQGKTVLSSEVIGDDSMVIRFTDGSALYADALAFYPKPDQSLGLNFEPRG